MKGGIYILTYLIIISASIASICILDFLFVDPFSINNAISTLLSLLLGTLCVIVIDGLEALLIRRATPKLWYLPERRLFVVSKREFKFYKKIKIGKWKDKVPELGFFTGFSKKKLGDASSLPYLNRYLTEINYGVVIHLINAHTGFLVLFVPHCDAFYIWIPVTVVNYILSMAPVFILRYTSHMLLKIYKMKQKEENKIKTAVN